jgi:hypothetical protein
MTPPRNKFPKYQYKVSLYNLSYQTKKSIVSNSLHLIMFLSYSMLPNRPSSLILDRLRAYGQTENTKAYFWEDDSPSPGQIIPESYPESPEFKQHTLLTYVRSTLILFLHLRFNFPKVLFLLGISNYCFGTGYFN